MDTRTQVTYSLGRCTERGYSFVELLVVMAIIGILSTQVVLSYNSAPSRLKGAIFNMRGDFNFARSEAVKRNQNVRVDFFFANDPVVANQADLDGDGAVDNGYRIWIDDAVAGYLAWNPATDDIVDPIVGIANGVCDPATSTRPAEGDCLLKAAAFGDEVSFYNVNAVGGPLVEAPLPNNPMNMANGDGDDDGVSFTNNWFTMRPDGTSSLGGTVYLYVPRTGQPTVMKAPPLALVLSPQTGRLQIWRWHTSQALWATN